MFVLRAAFWIAAVAVFAPQPPASALPRTDMSSAAIERFRMTTLTELRRVKAEFAAETRARSGHSHDGHPM
jgi:hypothetical protein